MYEPPFQRNSVQELTARNASRPGLPCFLPVPAGSAWAANEDAIFGAAHVEYSAAPAADGSYSLTYTGAPVDMYVKGISSDLTTDSYSINENYWVRYFEDTNHNDVFDAGDRRLSEGNGGSDEFGMLPPTEVGNYFIVAMSRNAFDAFAAECPDAMDPVANDSAFASHLGTKAQYFKVTPQDFSGVYAYEVNPDNAQDVSDTTFTYTGAALRVAFAIGNDVLTADDCTFDIVSGPGNAARTDEFVDAGEYKVLVTPNPDGAYGNYGQQTVTVTVGKLDLSKAFVYSPDRAKGDTVWAHVYGDIRVNGESLASLVTEDGTGTVAAAIVQYQYVDAQGNEYGVRTAGYRDLGTLGTTAPVGGYDYTLSATGQNANVVGEATFRVAVVEDLVDAAFYGTEDSATSVDFVTYFANGGEAFYGDEWSFDESLIKLQNDRVPYNGAKTVILRDANGNPVEGVSAAGRYCVTVDVPNADNFSLGGTFIAYFTYFKGQVDNNTVEAIATIDGTNVPFESIYDDRVYDGTPVEPKITLKAGSTALVEGSDYTVVYKNAQGETVDSMVDAGLYTVTVYLSEQYVYADRGRQANWFGVRISERVLERITYETNATDPANQDDNGNDLPGILYTGSEIDPVLFGRYKGTDGGTYRVTLDPTWYRVTGITYKAPGAERYTDVDAIQEPGDYRLNITATSALKNYTWLGGDGMNVSTDTDVDIHIIAAATFYDVPSTAWYAEEVAKAAAEGYVKGMGENLFFPEAEMTRAQFAQVLYNMAGEPEWNGDNIGAYPTQFSDVDGLAWYAKAVSWATEAGIVNGTSETTFDPEGKISREQIATMLWRYAGNGATADLSALDSFVDGDEVSEWAADEMAWAVEHGYMNGRGNNDLQPQGTATRAEIAALAVRVQPEAL